MRSLNNDVPVRRRESKPLLRQCNNNRESTKRTKFRLALSISSL
jgi:hypothetical protein